MMLALDRAEFHGALLFQPPAAVAGFAADREDCPLARWLRVLMPGAWVTVYELTVAADQLYTLPLWAARFVNRVDGLDERRKRDRPAPEGAKPLSVTAAQALAILQGVPA